MVDSRIYSSISRSNPNLYEIFLFIIIMWIKTLFFKYNESKTYEFGMR